MKETHGIKNTKELIKLAADLASVLKQAKENDGKIDLKDLPLVIGLSNSFGPAIDDANLALEEIRDLDSDEVKELINYLGSELDGKFTDKDLIKRLQAAVKFGIAAAELVAAF